LKEAEKHSRNGNEFTDMRKMIVVVPRPTSSSAKKPKRFERSKIGLDSVARTILTLLIRSRRLEIGSKPAA
jgi:hypothetical protein